MKKYFAFVLMVFFVSFLVSFAQETTNVDDLLRREADAKNKIAKKLLENDPYDTPNMKLYDVTYYQLNLEMKPNARQETGFVIMNARALSAIDFLELHKAFSLIVDSIKVDGQLTTYEYSSPVLKINLPISKNAGEMVSAQIFYHGTPSSEGFGFDTRNGKPMIWSLSEPYAARTWWPCKDLPRDKADSADIIITVPNDLIVASNGNLREEKELSDSKKQFWWHEQYPIATYLISIAIHPYHVFYDEYTSLEGNKMPLQFYVFPDNYSDRYPYYMETKEMIHAFANLFGEYPFLEEKYGHAEFLGWAAGMEHQTLTSLNGVGETLIAHELAHQWWGDMITCRNFHHIWLNEGFATYSEALWREWKYGEQAYHDYQKSRFYFGNGTIYVEDPLSDNIFSYNLSYRKASCVLHMLRHVVGDSVFFDILHEYRNDPQFKYGTATTEDFQAICEQVSGMDLAEFFHQWIYEEGYPYYQYYFLTKKLPDDQIYLFGIINQVQSFGPIFKMPVDVTIETDAGDTTFVVWTQNETDTFSVILDSEPRAIELDKDDWILCRKEFSSRQIFSVASYKISDETGNNNGKWDAGETIDLRVEIINNGMPLENAAMVLHTEDEMIAVQDSTAFIGGINYQASFTNENEPFRLYSDPLIYGKMVPLQLSVYENEQLIANVKFSIPVGKPTILLLDDDNEQNYQSAYEEALASTNNYYDYWNSQGKNFPDSLTKYKTVIWFQGTQSSNLLSDQFLPELEDFLNKGGNLVIFSQNMAEFIANSGDGAKIDFMENYLGIALESSHTSEPILVGKSGDPISSGMAITFNGPYGIDNQLYRDEIAPANGGISIFNYLQSKKSAAVRFEPPGTEAKVVFFAFGLEGIAGPSKDTASRLIGNVFNWFNPLTEVGHKISEMPGSYQIFQNYPNPFNPETTISYSLPKISEIDLTIYNLQGQKIKTLFRGKQAAGLHNIVWDGKDERGVAVASGIYVYRLSVENYHFQKKMILIR